MTGQRGNRVGLIALCCLFVCSRGAICGADSQEKQLLALALDDLLMPPAFLVPLVSPDGASVSYISDRCGANNIWFRPLVHPGQDRQLTREQGKGIRAMGFAGQAL